MRIVYDDTMQIILLKAVDEFMENYNINMLFKMDYGTERLQINLVHRALNNYLKKYELEIGNKVTHAHGLGNNNCYSVYSSSNYDNELQHCADINIDVDPFGDGRVYCTNYDGKRVGPLYRLKSVCYIDQHGNTIAGVKVEN